MASRFELFHLSLHEKIQGELLDKKSEFNREEWIRYVFSEKFVFNHRSVKIHWVPALNDEQFIAGNLVRVHQRRRHKSPEEGAAEEIGQEWQGAIVVIDPTNHSDGQKVAFEQDLTLGKPLSVLKSLLKYINSSPQASYVIESKPIFNEKSFWSWIEEQNFLLSKITFDFVTPNMFGTRSSLDNHLKEFGQIGASKVKMTLDEGSRDGGIDANSVEIRNAVDYSHKGGGSISAKAKNNKTYKSKDKTLTTLLPKEAEDRSSGLKNLRKWFFGLLGRE